MESLKGAQILIGKENNGNRLQIAVVKNGKRVYVSVPGCQPVPSTVSRLILNGGSVQAHCSIQVDAAGRYILTNLKPQNMTYVDGMECYQKSITPQSNVALGMNGYPLNLQSILSSAAQLAHKIDGPSTAGGNISGGGAPKPPKPKPSVSIAHLEGIWNRYEADVAAVRRKTRRINILASSSSVFSLGSIILSSLSQQLGIDKSQTQGLVIFTVIAFAIALVSIILRIRDNSEQQIKDLTDRFMHEYNCPHCGKFLGNQKFFLLQQAGGHSCGCKFR